MISASQARSPRTQPSTAPSAIMAPRDEPARANVDANAEGGGTDAAFAALQTKNAVIERFGLQGFGAHSANDEYVLLDSIEPRLYLATRLIMDFAQGKVKP